MTEKNREELRRENETLRNRVAALEGQLEKMKPDGALSGLLLPTIEQTNAGIAIVDMQGNLLYVNPSFANSHGYDPDELVGKHLSIFHVPEQMPAVEADLDELVEQGKSAKEIWHKRRDGTVFPTIMQNSLLHDESGNPVA